MTEAYVIKNVEAIWPKLDRTYHFDKKVNKSMPCDPMAPNAEYSIELKMDSETARNLYIAMVKSYTANKKDNWPDNPANPMTKHDDGTRTVKCTLKGQYNGEITRKPLQFDSKNNPMDADFQLTTGSIVNIAVTFYAYKYLANDPSVSLRIKQLQVVRLAERTVRSMFDKVEDGYVHNSESVFESNVVDMAKKKDEGVDLTNFEEYRLPDEPEPVKAPVKKAAASAPNSQGGALENVLDAWDD